MNCRVDLEWKKAQRDKVCAAIMEGVEANDAFMSSIVEEHRCIRHYYNTCAEVSFIALCLRKMLRHKTHIIQASKRISSAALNQYIFQKAPRIEISSLNILSCAFQHVKLLFLHYKKPVVRKFFMEALDSL